MKETWKKPELIVMVRSKPEEAVLTSCKIGPSSTGPAGFQCVTGGVCVELLPS